MVPFEVKTIVKHPKFMQPIKKGQAIWTFQPTANSEPVANLEDQSSNIIWTKQEIQALEPERIKTILHYGAYHAPSNIYVQLKDGGNYINNLKDPTLATVFNEDIKKQYLVAVGDLETDQELTSNYSEEGTKDMPWIEELLKKYSPGRWLQNH